MNNMVKAKKNTYKIYARADEKNRIIKFFSSVFEEPLDTDILVEEGNQEYHVHVQLKYIAHNSKGQYRYKLVDNKVVERTLEELNLEIQEEQSKMQPSLNQRMNDIEEAVALIVYGG